VNTLRAARVGMLEVVLTDGTVERMGDLKAELRARVTVHDNNFFTRLLKSADLGFAEAFMQAEVTVDDLTAFFKVRQQ
jgi:cyclopropane-fatty-acyl-phospholipid synthase